MVADVATNRVMFAGQQPGIQSSQISPPWLSGGPGLRLSLLRS